MDTINKALADYRAAVRSAKYWEDNGYRGDGKLEAATDQERECLTRLKLAIRGERAPRFTPEWASGDVWDTNGRTL